jgi:hypothetical protein
MKQLLSLFLFLLPCLAWAQYPSNGNQKITLGEQTTADGLIYRGVLADTGIITPSSDTSAYIILDTVNHRFYNYNRATNVWSVAGGGTAVTTFSAGTTGLTPNTATSGAVTLAGTLAVANGGTGSATQNFVDLTTTQTVAGAKTFSNAATFSSTVTAASTLYLGPDGTYGSTYKTLGLTGTTNGSHRIFAGTADNLYIAAASGRNIVFWTDGSSGTKATISTTGAATFSSSVTGNRYIINGSNGNAGQIIQQGDLLGTAGTNLLIHSNTGNAIGFLTNGGTTFNMFINASGNVGIGTTSPQSGYRLHVVDSVYVGGNVSASAYTTRSDFNLKDDIFDLKYGLNEILNLQPVEYTYKSNGSKQLGFIAQDIGTILPEVVSFEESMSVNYQAIIPILTKAIQEQQALIKALEQRIINLENK